MQFLKTNTSCQTINYIDRQLREKPPKMYKLTDTELSFPFTFMYN